MGESEAAAQTSLLAMKLIIASLIAFAACAYSCGPGDYCMCGNNPQVCHATKAPCSCSGPPPPPPSPGANFQQLQCTDDKCQVGCQLNTYPMNQCLKTGGGGSDMITSCGGGKVVTTTWGSNDCTGSGSGGSMTTGQCLFDSSTQSSFINTCVSGYEPEFALKLFNTTVAPFVKTTDDTGLPGGVNCKTDKDCPCSYCKNDSTKKAPYLCQQPKAGICCKVDADCKVNGPGSYCQTYKPKSGTASMPWHCHL